MADLTPAPMLVNRLMEINLPAEEDGQAYFATHAAECQALIFQAFGPRAETFLRAHPSARKIHRSVAGHDYELLLAK